MVTSIVTAPGCRNVVIGSADDAREGGGAALVGTSWWTVSPVFSLRVSCFWSAKRKILRGRGPPSRCAPPPSRWQIEAPLRKETIRPAFHHVQTPLLCLS